MIKNQVFEVDLDGLRTLMGGKPKWFVIRELLQNAFDEAINKCAVIMTYERGTADILVVDDSPIGFRDLSDIYTLFKDTYKRSDTKKRGRFNFGEKQVICLCESFTVKTTTGSFSFDGQKKSVSRSKRNSGSEVRARVKMTRSEFIECQEFMCNVIPPHGINQMGDEYGIIVEFHGNPIPTVKPHKEFNANLSTEILMEGAMRTVRRDTKVSLYDNRMMPDAAMLLFGIKLPQKETKKSFLYEMGIPICEIECDYSIDVHQKVPLGPDRDKVTQSYLNSLFSIVLDNTHAELSEENISSTWVRLGTSNANETTVKSVIKQRFGEKAVIANNFDPISVDDAKAGGYHIINNSDLSKEERARIKELGIVQTSTERFGKRSAPSTTLIPNHNQRTFSTFFKWAAKQLLNMDLIVEWIESPEADVLADFGGNTVRFNVSRIPEHYWNTLDIINGNKSLIAYPSAEILDLFIHEISHSRGHHTERTYLDCITMCAGKLARLALTDREKFDLNRLNLPAS